MQVEWTCHVSVTKLITHSQNAPKKFAGRFFSAVRHNGKHAVQICEARGTAYSGMVPWLGESGVGGVVEEMYGTGTEPPQGFKRDSSVQSSIEGWYLFISAVCKAR
jgi:hypothetical protein